MIPIKRLCRHYRPKLVNDLDRVVLAKYLSYFHVHHLMAKLPKGPGLRVPPVDIAHGTVLWPPGIFLRLPIGGG